MAAPLSVPQWPASMQPAQADMAGGLKSLDPGLLDWLKQRYAQGTVSPATMEAIPGGTAPAMVGGAAPGVSADAILGALGKGAGAVAGVTSDVAMAAPLAKYVNQGGDAMGDMVKQTLGTPNGVFGKTVGDALAPLKQKQDEMYQDPVGYFTRLLQGNKTDPNAAIDDPSLRPQAPTNPALSPTGNHSAQSIWDMIDGKIPVPQEQPITGNNVDGPPEDDRVGGGVDGNSSIQPTTSATSNTSSANAPVLPQDTATASGVTAPATSGPGAGGPPPELARVDALMKQYQDLIKGTQDHPYQAPTLQSNPSNLAGYDSAVTPNQPNQGKESIGHKILSFLVAGAGPLDPTRLARQENDLRLDQQKMTEKEKTQASVGATDIAGTDEANRAMQMHQYETGGMSPQTQAGLNILGGQIGQAGKGLYERMKLAEETKGKLDVQAASPEMVKTTPDYMEREASLAGQNKLISEHPELVSPDTIAKKYGMALSDQERATMNDTLNKMRTRLGFPPIQVIEAQMMQSLLQSRGIQMPGSSQTQSQPTQPSAATLNLNALKR